MEKLEQFKQPFSVTWFFNDIHLLISHGLKRQEPNGHRYI
jgi:hypothetical protein